jgi:hypothetical protein
MEIKRGCWKEGCGARLVEKWGEDFDEVGMGMGFWKLLGEIREK